MLAWSRYGASDLAKQKRRFPMMHDWEIFDVGLELYLYELNCINNYKKSPTVWMINPWVSGFVSAKSCESLAQ